jgi:hypothetical protein
MTSNREQHLLLPRAGRRAHGCGLGRGAQSPLSFHVSPTLALQLNEEAIPTLEDAAATDLPLTGIAAAHPRRPSLTLSTGGTTGKPESLGRST